MVTYREVLAELIGAIDARQNWRWSKTAGSEWPILQARCKDAWAAARARLALPEAVPSGYAYRYEDGLRFHDGCTVNGSKPIEAVPYFLGEPRTQSKDDLAEARTNDARPRPGVFLIKFDDTEVGPEIVIGEAAARERFRRVSTNWNAHLFVKVASNSRDDPYYSDNALTPPPDWRNLLMLIRPYVEDAGTRGYDGTGGHDMRETANKRLAAIDAALAAPQINAPAPSEDGFRIRRDEHGEIVFVPNVEQAISGFARAHNHIGSLLAYELQQITPTRHTEGIDLTDTDQGKACRAAYIALKAAIADQINALAGTPALPSREVTGSPGAPTLPDAQLIAQAVLEHCYGSLGFDDRMVEQTTAVVLKALKP